MADVVQFRLERMVDELDDLEQRGLFSRREIAEIVKQRRKYEYRLKRPSPLKQDFLEYIDVLRIMDVYEQALKRYKGDIDLWFRYLEFCRLKKNGRMKKALAKLVRFHPKVPGVWIYAAAWEFDHNLNVAAARALMQEGLRVCPTSEDLWVEYLRMELTYLNKLKARKVALGEDEGTLTSDRRAADEKQWRDENQELFMSLNENEENDKSNVESDESKKKQEVFAEHGMSIFRTIYIGAVEAVPSSLNLQKRFLEILEGIKLANSEEMCKEILSDMKRNFLTDPEFWDWLARREYNPENVQGRSEDVIIAQMQKAIQVYEEALISVPSGSMFRFYVSFLMGFITRKGGETNISGSSGQPVNYVEHLLTIFKKAEGMECLTEDLACDYLSFYLQLGQLDEARKLAEKLCCGTLGESVQLWGLRISIEMKRITRISSPSDADHLFFFELLKDILSKFPVSKSENLWEMALKFYANQTQYFDKLLEISVVSLARDGGSENGFSLSSAFVRFILQKDGIQQARDVYKRFLALPHPGLVLYRNCIDLETNLALSGDKDALMNARKLYESALATYDQDVNLWQDYHQMEIKMGTSEMATSVVWRARRTLKDAGRFIASSDLG
ncbi:U3 small nucleolar RNA-associated protein 6-like protein [Senna tora]|uniref:U3 small nucleolar RNA-associated protein 6-like protein n=1 Tax=Senna tora TaxID=362788 RepID=A0A834XDN6_9FABA|nr:U3 small nucleolar RNA-associated protein 6-like protein [Senna tora]